MSSRPPEEYKIVSAKDSGELESRVNEKLAEGWRLCGGVALHVYPGLVLMIQAMTRNYVPEEVYAINDIGIPDNHCPYR